MKKNTLSVMAVLICVCICFITIFSFAFITLHAKHDCTGENCPICAELSFAVSTLKTVSEAIGDITFAFSAFCLCLVTLIGCTSVYITAETAVTQKVKLNI